MSQESMPSGSNPKWEILSGSTKLGETSQDIYRQALGLFEKLGDCKEWIITNFGYAGFDILTFRTLIRKKIDSRIEDLAFLVTVFLVKGNNVSRILDSTNSAQVVERLKKLVTKLSIKAKAAGRTQTVTLSRIAISFPEIVGVILQRHPEIPGALRIEHIREILKTPDYPSLARQPALACFLPKGHPESNSMLNVFLVCNILISEVINTNNQKRNALTDVAKANTTKIVVLNAFNSALHTEDERRRWCVTLGIMIGDEFTSAWRQAAISAKKMLEERYKTSF